MLMGHLRFPFSKLFFVSFSVFLMEGIFFLIFLLTIQIMNKKCLSKFANIFPSFHSSFHFVYHLPCQR